MLKKLKTFIYGTQFQQDARRVRGFMRIWTRIEGTDGGGLPGRSILGGFPPENQAVDIAIENGNCCHPIDNCYYLAGEWYKASGEKIENVEVYGWADTYQENQCLKN